MFFSLPELPNLLYTCQYTYFVPVNTPTWFLSIHLLGSCQNTYLITVNTPNDTYTLYLLLQLLINILYTCHHTYFLPIATPTIRETDTLLCLICQGDRLQFDCH